MSLFFAGREHIDRFVGVCIEGETFCAPEPQGGAPQQDLKVGAGDVGDLIGGLLKLLCERATGHVSDGLITTISAEAGCP